MNIEEIAAGNDQSIAENPKDVKRMGQNRVCGG